MVRITDSSPTRVCQLPRNSLLASWSAKRRLDSCCFCANSRLGKRRSCEGAVLPSGLMSVKLPVRSASCDQRVSSSWRSVACAAERPAIGGAALDRREQLTALFAQRAHEVARLVQLIAPAPAALFPELIQQPLCLGARHASRTRLRVGVVD